MSTEFPILLPLYLPILAIVIAGSWIWLTYRRSQVSQLLFSLQLTLMGITLLLMWFLFDEIWVVQAAVTFVMVGLLIAVAFALKKN